MKQNGIKMIKWWRLETSGKFVNTFIFFLGLHGHEGNWQGRLDLGQQGGDGRAG
jgi:hypothetical protein